MRKICIFNGGVKNSGGIERVAANLANMWVDGGNKVDLVIADECTSSFFPLNNNVNIISLKRKYSSSVMKQIVDFIKLIVLFRRYAKKNKPDIVMGMWTSRAIIGTIACLGTGVPVVACEHTAYEKARFDFKILRWIVYRWSSAIVSLTERDTRIYKRINTNAYTIPNYVKNIKYKIRTSKNKVILCVGWISYEKGIDRLLEIWSKIFLNYPEWKLKIIGKVPEDKVLFADELKNMQDKYCFGSQLEIIDSTKKIFDEYNKADIFVMTSRYEGLPMVLLEAMGTGLPVVSFDCPTGPQEIINNNENGFLIDDGDIHKFSDRLSELIENENKRMAMGKAGYNMIDSNYRESVIADEWNELIEECIRK